ncbi:hypothetical protein QSJ19_26250 [Gordonia sp. ABSL11-1]|uniref:hypothetical protein n=1 Tax=Gordonia sp. ABSL11-1 TaxID=3053924 RepID=UPI002572FB4C|nr:hypothetical protein [Gordonia sp. ABSL11-1]MDL9949015.1 hypothetical protein [Gordonia sp. ABSL11-1]
MIKLLVIVVVAAAIAVALVMIGSWVASGVRSLGAGLGRLIRGGESADETHPELPTVDATANTAPADALATLAGDLRAARTRRLARCREIQEVAEPTESRRYLDLAVDTWPEAAQDRDRLRNDSIGQIAISAGIVADRVTDYPAWKLDFYDRHGVRVDLAAEVVALATSAAHVREQVTLLGQPPTHLRTDHDVVDTYTAKARLLSRRLDGLVDRLEALAEYQQIVAAIQHRLDKREWLDRVSAIDEFENEVDAQWDTSEADRIRTTADESEMLASIYLDALAPLAKRLEQE